MKLWHKLTIVIFVIINIIVQIWSMVITPKVNDFAVELLGEKLISIASATAASINGDNYKNIDLFDTTGIYSETYTKIRNTIEKTKKNLELTSDKYTITLLNNNSIAFGVVLNRVPFSKDSLQELGKEAINAVYEVYDKKESVYTNVYKDRYGEWLSGFSPIRASNNEIVGIVQVDENYSSVKSTISEIEMELLYGRLILLPFSILISLLVAKIFLKPIKKLKNKLHQISIGDYSNTNNIKASGEIKELIDATENLRLTIVEQQTKIFTTISNLKASKEKVEISDNLKSEFLAVLSHEIRTPLNVILGSINILQLEIEDNNYDEIENLSKSISRGSNRLIRTVEMIVLYSELVSKTYNKQEKYITLDQTYFDIVEKYKEEARQKGITIKIDCIASSSKIKFDENLFKEAIIQLVDNAVKYTNNGEIKLCIVEDNNLGLYIIIEDTGIGISEDFQKELYKPFRQEDMSYRRKYEGNGVGLALAKKCLDLNGFDLKIESQKGKGTKAKIFIPKEKYFDVSNI
ncbi:MAG: HAMP domain-containing histidine kinase [Ignavibacteria bacterium]|nr:HAMP domain-containing histidine kinase [Ignavibacteria bacterium]